MTMLVFFTGTAGAGLIPPHFILIGEPVALAEKIAGVLPSCIETLAEDHWEVGGVAVLSGILEAPDPAVATRAYLQHPEGTSDAVLALSGPALECLPANLRITAEALAEALPQPPLCPARRGWWRTGTSTMRSV